MKLTAFTDYSLRLLVYLALQPARRVTIAEIAGSFGISQNHLVKVAHFLGKRGFVATARGKGGGLQLARAPECIGVGQVVRQSEGAAEVAECFGQATSSCVIAPCCRLKGVLGEAVTAFYAVLDRSTLADLVTDRDALAAVLLVPRTTGARLAGSTA